MTDTPHGHDMTKPISPPPTKRRRLDPTTPTPAPPSSTTLRIISWNINGISPFLPPTQKSIATFLTPTSPSPRSRTRPPSYSLRAFLRRHSFPDLLLLQEVHISPTDHATQAAVRRAVACPPASVSASSSADPEPEYAVFFTLPTDRHNATGFGRRVHGVCTIVRADFLAQRGGRVRSVDWDAEGRFSVLETDGGAGGGWPRLSIWNVYGVNGTDYAWKHSRTGEVVGTRHGRKRVVQRLMQDEVRRLEQGEHPQGGRQVVLAGDMNVARDSRDGVPALRTRPVQHVENREDFNARFFGTEDGGLGMLDSFRELHGDRKGYTYYPRGVEWGSSCDRVDYVICSKGLRTNLKEAGMLETKQERGPSDHVPVYAVFDFAESSTTATDTDKEASDSAKGEPD